MRNTQIPKYRRVYIYNLANSNISSRKRTRVFTLYRIKNRCVCVCWCVLCGDEYV